MQCACYIAESDDKNPLRLNPCPEHERWARAIRDYEREACAKIAAEGSFPFDIDIWITATKKEMTAHTANAIADAIRARRGTGHD